MKKNTTSDNPVEPTANTVEASERTDYRDKSNEDEECASNSNRNGSDRYPSRKIYRPKYLNDYACDTQYYEEDGSNMQYCYAMNDVPSTYNDAVQSPEADQWKNAMLEEMSALKQNSTYDLVDLPAGKKVVGGRWVYTKKVYEGNTKFKARYVAKGYLQKENVDYGETFAPTARMTSIRMLVQIAAQENTLLHQMDVKSAYLNAPIDCELYLEQPQGFEIVSKSSNARLVCKLNKSIYGLKQSGRNWCNVLSAFLESIGFERSIVDPCVYYRYSERTKTIIVTFVDDLIIGSTSAHSMSDVKSRLCSRFHMKDMGCVSNFLGVRFTKIVDGLRLDQTEYINNILRRFGMSDCKPRATPCEPNVDKLCMQNWNQITADYVGRSLAV